MTKHLGRPGLYLDTGKLALYDNYNDAVMFDSMSEFVASLQALLDAGNAHYSTNYQIVEASAPAEPLIDMSELTLLPDPYKLYDIGIQSAKGVATKITPIWSDELRVHEFFGEDGQIL